jgi:small-conductance mechanosensitive channel
MLSSFVDMHKFVADLITPERISLYIRIILILLIGIPLIRLLRRIVGKVTAEKLSLQSSMLLKRFVYYIGWLIILITVLNELGFKLSALLGAAGVFGIAIGFASQTSFANIISGIFLISEKPFTVGEVIQLGDTIGEVTSIDLLSVKVRTFDNKFIRVPNENMIKSEITNLTRYDVRRVNMSISVAYKENLNKVIALLKTIAAEEPLALQDREPAVLVDQFADSGIVLMYGVWGKADDYAALKTAILLQVKQRFEAEGIEIPFPHVKLANDASTPLPLLMTSGHSLSGTPDA